MDPGQTRPTNHSLNSAMRASICCTVAWATSGPPVRWRRRVWMTAWESPDLRDQEETSRCNSLRRAARSLGTTLEEPFLQLAFLALPVIPALKITDCGMVDVARFEIIP